jgi:hypothetical protein
MRERNTGMVGGGQRAGRRGEGRGAEAADDAREGAVGSGAGVDVFVAGQVIAEPGSFEWEEGEGN